MIIIEQVLLLLSILIIFGLSLLDLCDSIKSENIRHHLGTRTPYRIKYNKNDSKIKFRSEFWLVVLL